MRALACLPLLAGCTQLLGLDNLHQNGAASDAPVVPPDDGMIVDAIDAADGPPITISGKATSIASLTSGSTPIADLKIELLRVSDESVVTSTLTDGAGLFSLTVPAGSDIMLRAAPAQPPFAIVLPSAPPTADADFSFNIFSDQALEQLGSVCPGNPNGVDLNLGQILVLLADATNTPQAGYNVASLHPGQATCYPTAGGSGNATSTQGAAIVFDVAPGIDQIQAIDATGPVATSRAWAVAARSQSFLRLEVPTHATP